MRKTNDPVITADGGGLADAHGPIPVRMTNDYLFRALMQENINVLKALLYSLLHLKAEEVNSVIILNPIELGKHVDEKNFILDIKIILNLSISTKKLKRPQPNGIRPQPNGIRLLPRTVGSAGFWKLMESTRTETEPIQK